MFENLLVTKLYIPSLVATHVARPRLFQLLDEGLRLGRRLTLISTPAGYGKTTLIAEWIHRQKLPAAWISLDEGDNDPVRFFSYLIAAIRTVKPEVGDLSPIHFPPGESYEGVLVPLVNELAKVKEPLLLVLDDYHTIHAQPIHDALAFLIENLPPNVHIFMASRADPPLPIARLRARGQLLELRLGDLRFTAEETATFINLVMGLSLSPEDITALDSRTEGWAAGLQLAALALQASDPERQSTSGFVRSFTGSNRYVLDYLVEEVLQRQPETVQTFLLHTSILDRFCGSLCEAVTPVGEWRAERDQLLSTLQSPTSARQILEYLDRSNLFIVPLDDRREWYRYHRLFADLLSQRLSLTQPGIKPGLHRRASEWYEQHQFMDGAIQHAFAGGDTRRAAELIEAAAEATLMRSEMATFMGWVAQLPELELQDRPNLIVYRALALIWNGAPLEVIEASLAIPERGETLLSGKEAPLRAFIAINQGQIALARDYSRQALELIPESDLLLRGLADLMQAMCYMVAGDVQIGVQLLEKAVITNRKTGNLMVAVLVLYQLAELRHKEGKLRQALVLYRQALELASDKDGRYLPIAGRALAGLGEIAREWNDLEAAQRYILEGNELTEKWSQVGAFDGYLALVQIRQSQGDVDGAGQAVNILRKIARQFDMSEVDDLVVDLVEARLWIARGELLAAHQWARQRGLEGVHLTKANVEADHIISVRLRKYELLVLARLWLEEGRNDEALQVLDQQLAQLDKIDRPVLTIETELLRAMAFQAKRETAKALLALEHALSLAEPEGFVRIFIDEGEKMQALLRSARSKLMKKTLAAFVEKLLLAFTTQAVAPGLVLAPQTGVLIEPLSERETEVLHLLPSSLSSREMADELYISVHTLRSHVKSIYEKFGVHSRYEAIVRAQELDLL
jgi:LuxR family maltose regulon positive regulatory protein